MTDEMPSWDTREMITLFLIMIFVYAVMIFIFWRLGIFNHCPAYAAANDTCNFVV